LTREWRDDPFVRLGKNDIAVRLKWGKPKGLCGFVLTFVNASYARSDNLTHISTRKHRKNYRSHDIAIVKAKIVGKDIEKDQNLHQKRCSPDKLNIKTRKKPQKNYFRVLPICKKNSDKKA